RGGRGEGAEAGVEGLERERALEARGPGGGPHVPVVGGGWVGAEQRGQRLRREEVPRPSKVALDEVVDHNLVVPAALFQVPLESAEATRFDRLQLLAPPVRVRGQVRP